MQTFLPYESFAHSAHCLDDKRLGKQRPENLQIIRALTLPNYGWKKHPAVKMWKGHEVWLFDYHQEICDEWEARGFDDTCREKFKENFESAGLIMQSQPPPWWLGNEDFHASHRSNLLAKDPEWYAQWGWEDEDDMPYFWPTKEKEFQ